MHNIIFDIALLLSCAYAFWVGDSDSRLIASICIAASLLSLVLIRPIPMRFTGVEFGVMMVDVLTLAGFVAVALTSTRFWPLWIAGLQLTTLLAHLSVRLDLTIVPQAYAVAAVFWSYPILIILAIGSWRAHRRASDPREARQS